MEQSKLPEFFGEATRVWFKTTLGEPTAVQREAWPAIAEGKHTLVSAPTGTGKTLTAFLVLIDRLIREAREGKLKAELQLIYVSPLKALATDIRENLKRPLEGIYKEELAREDGVHKVGSSIPQQIHVAIRTGDTTQTERRNMVKKPPHILITTPESLYLLLTSKSGKEMLSTANYIILDELHAVIESKRGAHMMLSIARLDAICKKPLQRIGLSATIEPLSEAARYLAPEPVEIIAPKMNKKVELEIISPKPDILTMMKDSVWKDIAAKIYEECQKARSVITFVDGRRFAEKLSYYISEFGGEDFARVHHGSLSKEQRQIVEQELKRGELKLLIATSSMELGIDVGEIDKVFQVGNPQTISSTMQRLGRAGHRPNQTSIMQIYPRTAEEGLYCGMTAEVVRQGGVEHSKSPRVCLDILAQHLVSMAAFESYEVADVMPILQRAYPFHDVTVEDVKDVLCMLAGDYEHNENIPVRPRILYDRIHERVEGDAYSRMLSVSAGGTIPDRGMFAVKSESGVKLGELEEEFIFESRVGDKFMLGSFAWRIQKITKDSVIVVPSESSTAKLPFWKGEIKGRKMQTGIAFGKILRELNQAYVVGTLNEELVRLGLDEVTSENAADYVERQIQSTEVLPSDQTILIEHFKDETGNHQMMIHSVFGNPINAPLGLLLHEYANTLTQRTINYVEDDDGILLFPYDGKSLPTGMLQEIRPETAKKLLEAMLPATPLFNIIFRYNAGRALMMGARKFSRQPLWVQRARSAQMLDSVVQHDKHPLIRETKRECLEDYWDLDGLVQVLEGIQSGSIQIREMYQELPSPMSFLLRKKTELSLMYDYSPTPTGIIRATESKIQEVKNLIAPDVKELERVLERRKLPEDEKQLHSLLMIEGDLIAGELELPLEWLESLAKKEQVNYIEPGLWIAAEQRTLYEEALERNNEAARVKIVLRLLRYRGGYSSEQLARRYFWSQEEAESILQILLQEDKILAWNDSYYHKELYEKARTETILSRREIIKTQPSNSYTALISNRMSLLGTPMEQMEEAAKQLCHRQFLAELWESVLLPARVTGYRPELLDKLLAQGTYFWKLSQEGMLSLERYEQIDWDYDLLVDEITGTEREKAICTALKKRGASFMNSLAQAIDGDTPHEELLGLASKGIVCADSFAPVRYWLNQEKIKKSGIRQQVNARVKLLSEGRWDFVRPIIPGSMEKQIEQAFEQVVILSRETAQGLVPWSKALEVLRIWEYTGKVRRGYFVEGLSGVQFILDTEFTKTMRALENPSKECIWMSAIDPAQLWGKRFPHHEDKAFMNLAGTYVALVSGEPVAVLERKGKVLRIFDESKMEVAVHSFVKGFVRHSLYPNEKRITIKEYPEAAGNLLSLAGFRKEMLDYVLYR